MGKNENLGNVYFPGVASTMNEEERKYRDLALIAPSINTNPGEEYGAKMRKWQGIPGIERMKNGRLYCAFYSGGETEGEENFVIVIKSDDDGNTFSEPILVIDPPGKVRAFDPCLWIDPMGKLWLFWAQSYTFVDGQFGTWAIMCENPDDEKLLWSKPKRLANGVMMNKPVVLSTGEWLLPCSIWKSMEYPFEPIREEQYSNVYISKDDGVSFKLWGSADLPDRFIDEHMIVERKDSSLWMLVRTKYGIGESISKDKGANWEHGKPTNLRGPVSRFFIRRLKSGNLLLVNHYNTQDKSGSEEIYKLRNNLTAMISNDDGLTWKGFLMLDERIHVSYPDGTETEDGLIYVVYDRERRDAKEILMAVFTEEDVLAGKCVTDKARLKVLVSKAEGVNTLSEFKKEQD